ncbi:PAS domain S-box protein [Gigaspora margarita]|uniref:PAS domain S-box protein n=1 Tax=Gigaspora margarita TaxID=4874 RepID=A0A8H3X8P5_GIGMA|nr:PAS domain S-box protein [Gigaspora margarita]
MSSYNDSFEEDESDFVSNVYNYDWSSTSLGPMELFNNNNNKNNDNNKLHTNFRIYAFPTLISIAPDWIAIYNKAWRPLIKSKHPYALGKPVKEIWPDIYEIFVAKYER